MESLCVVVRENVGESLDSARLSWAAKCGEAAAGVVRGFSAGTRGKLVRYAAGMRTALLVSLLMTFAAATELPAQNKRSKKGSTQKEQKAPKDDSKTAKDKVIRALDKFRKRKAKTKGNNWRTRLPQPPVQKFDAKLQYRWHVDTSVGPLVITLLPEAAPNHVTSVIFLARCGFYDGLQFPRVLKGFMAQGGSPTNTQSGDPGYTMDGEFLTKQKHDKPGALSAANSGPGTDGSQFFLTFVPTPHLDGLHTVHGFVTEGQKTLKAIESLGVKEDGQPLKEKVTILRTWIRVVDAPQASDADDKKDKKADREPSDAGKCVRMVRSQGRRPRSAQAGL
tara:strand:- start:21958 stop:22965 length:1008 start_codon:yes stop_codon:yes gene_type:complete